jgi:hypothetical protein
MKLLAVSTGLVLTLAAGSARAAYLDLCCDSVARPDGSCVASEQPCPNSTGFALDLHNISTSEAISVLHWPPECATDKSMCPEATPNFTDVEFPSGIDGYSFITKSAPWWGLCFLAPDANDPKHLFASRPSSCFTTSLKPGVGAEIADWQFPDGAWDAVERCYGAAIQGAMPGQECQLPAALRDPTLSVVDGSCCEPPVLLDGTRRVGNSWTFDVGQEIPGVLPPYSPDLKTCVYPMCGTAPASTGFPSPTPTQPTASRSEQPMVSDAGAPAGGCSVSGGSRPSWALLLGLLALVRRRRYSSV